MFCFFFSIFKTWEIDYHKKKKRGEIEAGHGHWFLTKRSSDHVQPQGLTLRPHTVTGVLFFYKIQSRLSPGATQMNWKSHLK